MRLNLLCADNQPGILFSLKLDLDATHNVLAATTWQQAIDALRSEPVDAVLVSVDFPGENGKTLLQQLKSEYPNVIRIGLGGEKLADAGMDLMAKEEIFRFLRKPWTEESLKFLLDGVVKRISATRKHKRTDVVKDKLLAAMEARHPGISKVELTDGSWVIDEQKVNGLDPALTPELYRLIHGAPG